MLNITIDPRSAAVARLAVTLSLITTACGPEAAPPVELGAEFHNPLHPEFTLTDTDGNAFDFGSETRGYMTLLFFGYTNCPDICPVHMANIGAALDRLPYSVTSRVKVVFVTTDPERDTPGRIREWLDHFDTGFIGLTGTLEEIAAAEREVKIAPSQRVPRDDGGYDVGHSARVIAFTTDGAGRFLYPFGTRQSDWASEIPALVGWQPEQDAS